MNALFLAIILSISFSIEAGQLSRRPASIEIEISQKVGQSIFHQKKFLSTVEHKGEKVSLNYSLNQDLQSFVKRLLGRFRTDYASIVVLDVESGDILAAADFAGKMKKYGYAMTFSGTHPAASLFKIVTASELLKKSSFDLDKEIIFSGKSTTLYKYQLKEPSRWKRRTSFERAFALSNNPVFGRVAVDHIKAADLFKTALDFGFHTKLLSEIEVGESYVPIAESSYHLAEIASGYNRETMMSPLHGAMLGAIIANNGVKVKPRLIISAQKEGSEKRTQNQIIKRRILDQEIAEEIKKMMVLTVERGTARSMFRSFLRRHRKEILVGGKTGTITGGVPHGRRDWFAAFAERRGEGPKKTIAICVMNVNRKKWYVKSTYLAKKVIEYYFNHLQVKDKLTNYESESSRTPSKKEKKKIERI